MLVFTDPAVFEEQSQELIDYLKQYFPKSGTKKQIDQLEVESVVRGQGVLQRVHYVSEHAASSPRKEIVTYRQLADFLDCVEDQDNSMNIRILFGDEDTLALKEKYPGLPQDYLDFLVEIGVGTYRECQFEVYDKLRTVEEQDIEHLFPDEPALLIFGHNFSGDCSAFDMSDGFAVVVLWHDNGDIYDMEQTFKKYIEEKCLMNEDGSDDRGK